MRRSMLVLGAVAAATAVTAPASQAKSAATKTMTIKARSKIEKANVVDNAPAGSSAGDLLVFTERLLDGRGRTIGHDAASCVRLFDERSLCSGVYTFKRGTVLVQLLQPGPTGTYNQQIVGGTGRYEDARGRVTVAQSSAGDRFTFKIRMPS